MGCLVHLLVIGHEVLSDNALQHAELLHMVCERRLRVVQLRLEVVEDVESRRYDADVFDDGRGWGVVRMDPVSEVVQREGGRKGRAKYWTARSMLSLARQSSELKINKNKNVPERIVYINHRPNKIMQLRACPSILVQLYLPPIKHMIEC